MPLPWWRGCGFARSSGTPWGVAVVRLHAVHQLHKNVILQAGLSSLLRQVKVQKDRGQSSPRTPIGTHTICQQFFKHKLLNIILTEFYCACTVTRYFIKSTSPLYLFSNPLPHISTSQSQATRGRHLFKGGVHIRHVDSVCIADIIIKVCDRV